MPERGPLFGAPVHPPLHRIDVNERQGVGAGQQRGPRGRLDHDPAVHRGELAHVAVVERPQETAQRRRGADPADRGRERAVAQQIHPVDGVRTGDHPGHQRTDLQPGVDADLGGHPHMLAGQVLQADALGQPHRRYQPGMRHQIRIIEPGMCHGRGVQQSHPRGALSILALRASTTRILPGQRALLLSRHTPAHNSDGGSRLKWSRDALAEAFYKYVDASYRSRDAAQIHQQLLWDNAEIADVEASTSALRVMRAKTTSQPEIACAITAANSAPRGIESTSLKMTPEPMRITS